MSSHMQMVLELCVCLKMSFRQDACKAKALYSGDLAIVAMDCTKAKYLFIVELG